jgi:hypothetical protein
MTHDFLFRPELLKLNDHDPRLGVKNPGSIHFLLLSTKSEPFLRRSEEDQAGKICAPLLHQCLATLLVRNWIALLATTR